jgi:hypothetical protein
MDEWLSTEHVALASPVGPGRDPARPVTNAAAVPAVRVGPAAAAQLARMPAARVGLAPRVGPAAAAQLVRMPALPVDRAPVDRAPRVGLAPALGQAATPGEERLAGPRKAMAAQVDRLAEPQKATRIEPAAAEQLPVVRRRIVGRPVRATGRPGTPNRYRIPLGGSRPWEVPGRPARPGLIGELQLVRPELTVPLPQRAVIVIQPRAAVTAMPAHLGAEQVELARPAEPMRTIVPTLAALLASTADHGRPIARARRRLVAGGPRRPAATLGAATGAGKAMNAAGRAATGAGKAVTGAGKAVTVTDKAATVVGKAVTGAGKAVTGIAPDRPDHRQAAAHGQVETRGGTSAGPNADRSPTNWTTRQPAVRDRPRPPARQFRPVLIRSCSIPRCVPSSGR